MSAKLNKINKEIEKTEKIIKENQDKLKGLYRDKDDLENLEMIDFLKKNKIQHSDLKSIVDILHSEKGDVIPLKTEIKEDNKNEEI